MPRRSRGFAASGRSRRHSRPIPRRWSPCERRSPTAPPGTTSRTRRDSAPRPRSTAGRAATPRSPTRHEASRRRKRERPSSAPTDLPGLSVAEAAAKFGVTAQAIYQRVNRGLLEARTVELPDGRKYKRVFPEE